MELAAILIFVFSLVSNEISRTLGLQTLVGNIQMLQKHPKLRECAEFILRKSYYVEQSDNVDVRYVGGRVSIREGQCEGLLQDFGFNETVLSGYAYFKYISVEEEHNPPVVVKQLKRAIPVVFRDGTKVTATFRTQEKPKTLLLIELDDQYRVTFQNSNVNLFNRKEGIRVPTAPFVADTTKKCELSFLAEKNAVRVHVNGVQIGIFPVNSPLSRVELLTITSLDDVFNNDLFIHSITVA